MLSGTTLVAQYNIICMIADLNGYAILVRECEIAGKERESRENMHFVYVFALRST